MGQTQGSDSLCPGLHEDPETCGPPSSSHSTHTGEGSRVADRGDSDLSGEDRSNVVASIGQIQDKICSSIPAESSVTPNVGR